MKRVLEKTERRLGQKLFLKQDRCLGPKCVTVRRNYPPGIHGHDKRRGSMSEFGQLMKEKQKARFLYGLADKDVAKLVKEASSKKGVFGNNFFQLVESRLDNVLFRLGIAPSRRMAFQLISHGHVLVNGKTVNIRSYRVKKGDEIGLKEKALRLPLMEGLQKKLEKNPTPAWLELKPSVKSGKVKDLPIIDESFNDIDAIKIREFYLR